LKSLAMNCGPLSEMMRLHPLVKFLGALQDELNVRLRIATFSAAQRVPYETTRNRIDTAWSA